MRVFSFSWKVILWLMGVSIVFLPIAFLSIQGILNGGSLLNPTPEGGWFLLSISLIFLISPLIYVCTQTWWSTKSIAKTIANITIALLIQVFLPLLILLGGGVMSYCYPLEDIFACGVSIMDDFLL